MRAPAGARCVVRGPARWSGAAARVERSMSLRQERRALLDRYIRIPTVSREVSPDLVDDVRGFWRGVGVDLEPLRGAGEEGTPVLYAELPGPPSAPSILLYGHYDVQPTGDPDLWLWHETRCEPFVPHYFLDGEAIDPQDVSDADLDRVEVVERGSC